MKMISTRKWEVLSFVLPELWNIFPVSNMAFKSGQESLPGVTFNQYPHRIGF